MRRERSMNPKCQTRPGFDTFSAKSADLTGLKMIRITRAVSMADVSRASYWKIAHTMRLKPAALRHFRPAYVRVGSIGSKDIGAGRRHMSGMPPKADMLIIPAAVLDCEMRKSKLRACAPPALIGNRIDRPELNAISKRTRLGNASQIADLRRGTMPAKIRRQLLVFGHRLGPGVASPEQATGCSCKATGTPFPHSN